MTKDEIAKELTLSIVNRLKTTDHTNSEQYNKSLATEVGHTYIIIRQAVESAENVQTENFYEIASKIRSIFN